MTPLLLAALAATTVSLLFSGAVLATLSRHGRFTMDFPGAARKAHTSPVPRVGGAGVYLALGVARAMVPDAEVVHILDTVLWAGLPALAAGLLEDVTKHVGVATRLAGTLASGALACWIGGGVVTHVDVPGIDTLLAVTAVGFAFTVFAVGGVTNAINMIDGFNGLASGAVAIALLAVAAIAAQVGDTPLMLAAIVVVAALGGFWLLNFPWGKLFLGDGGAYLAGFALAWLAVLLTLRNPSVSPWASLMVCGYPVIEVVYSVLRRWGQGGRATGADGGHLHSLVASQFVKRRLCRLHPTFQNSAVSVLMWICAAIPALLAVTSYGDTGWLATGALACLLLYHWLYRRLASA
jgi:UDP-N-acetylmuramyl pentapeptide phosphotransferase/UDP-N-acetylglucosamine-1-phosphate transferase